MVLFLPFLSRIFRRVGSGSWKCYGWLRLPLYGREGNLSLASCGLSLILNYGISRFGRVWVIDCINGCLAELHAFLGIIGGLLSYGPQGFVIGPMAVVLAYGLIRFFLVNQCPAEDWSAS